MVREGFEPVGKTVDLKESVQLQFTLAIAKQQESVTVLGKSLAMANSDPFYRQLRDLGLGQSYRFDNYTLSIDTATFQFSKGTLTVLNPVDGIETGAIFVGEGRFNLKPVLTPDRRELERRIGSPEVNEDFVEIVFRFTRDEWPKFSAGLHEQTGTPAEATLVLNKWRERMRQRRERPEGFSQGLLQGDTMDNVDADILAAVYNPQHPLFINAYIRGAKHKDLRYFVRTRVGALPQLDSPEEIALVNYDPQGMDDGVWYLAHFKSEYLDHSARSDEDRCMFATRSYKIETVIAKNQHFFSSATITFEPLLSKERVLKFGLLPTLRVSKVTDQQGRPLHWIQENRKEDGSFYALLAEAPEVGKQYSITIEYSGDKVLEEAGDGSFYVGARSSWYPNLNGFGEHALYDLTFKVPHKYKVVSVGQLQNETTESDFAVSRWVTPHPVAVAGFNYGDYKKMEMPGIKTVCQYSKGLPADPSIQFRDSAINWPQSA